MSANASMMLMIVAVTALMVMAITVVLMVVGEVMRHGSADAYCMPTINSKRKENITLQKNDKWMDKRQGDEGKQSDSDTSYLPSAILRGICTVGSGWMKGKFHMYNQSS